MKKNIVSLGVLKSAESVVTRNGKVATVVTLNERKWDSEKKDYVLHEIAIWYYDCGYCLRAKWALESQRYAGRYCIVSYNISDAGFFLGQDTPRVYGMITLPIAEKDTVSEEDKLAFQTALQNLIQKGLLDEESCIEATETYNILLQMSGDEVKVALEAAKKVLVPEHSVYIGSVASTKMFSDALSVSFSLPSKGKEKIYASGYVRKNIEVAQSKLLKGENVILYLCNKKVTKSGYDSYTCYGWSVLPKI